MNNILEGFRKVMTNVVEEFISLLKEDINECIISFFLVNIISSIFIVLILNPFTSFGSAIPLEFSFYNCALILMVINIFYLIAFIIGMLDSYYIKKECIEFKKANKEYAGETIKDIEARNDKAIAINREKRQIAKRLENLNK